MTGAALAGRAESEADACAMWSALAEPADQAASWLVSALGAREALAWVDQCAADPVGATAALLEVAPPATADAAVAAVPRWTGREGGAHPADLRRRAHRCEARLVWPGEPDWPETLNDLGSRTPFALWVRGRGDVAALDASSVAVVGCRSATAYGDHLAATLAADLAARGRVIVSGGAYGIDAAAHRGALAAGGATIAVMAGGVDRLYPAGNADLLARVLDSGVVVSEVPPGWAPHRQRFLSRNRIIACAGATVVVEAAHRSGALSTVAHAESMVRPVAAAPGPVTSATSAGCHGLIRDGRAVLVAQASDVAELLAPIGGDVSGEALTATDGASGLEFAGEHDRAAFDALGRRTRAVDEIATLVGLTVDEARAALGRLELAGLVAPHGPGWRRVPHGSRA